MISCILIYTHDTAGLNESVASWISREFDGQSELVILNCQLRQRLRCDAKGVRIIQAPRQLMPPQARNAAIEASGGDVIVNWPANDVCLPNHIANMANGIAGYDWCWLSNEFQMERGKITKLMQAGAFGFAFTKKAWLEVGKYGFGINGASGRNFIGKLTSRFPGQKITLPPAETSLVRCGTELEKSRMPRMVHAGNVVLVPSLRRSYSSLVKLFLGGSNSKKIGVVLLGRNGDIINVLPFLKLINDNYTKPHMVIAREFLPLFDGIGYATPVVMAEKEEDLGNAIARAKHEFEIVIRAQIWGRGHQQKVVDEAYNQQSWRDVGLVHRFNDETLRPVFDGRSAEREQALIEAIPDSGKPWLLVNLSSAISAPCPQCASLMASIQERWGGGYQIVDISKIRAERLYDFIGLFEKASALISLDTSFVHLALATNIPVVLLTRSGWGGTIMRMNCAGRILYDDAVKNPQLFHDSIRNAIQMSCDSFPDISSLSYKPIERRIFHVCDRHNETDTKNLDRKRLAQDSWNPLYESGALIPAHYWDTQYTRNAKDEIGDRRELPYFKDLLLHTMEQMDDDDILLWTNDDNIILPMLPEYLRFHLGVYGPCSILRAEFMGRIPSLELPPEQFDKGSRFHVGRDGFAFTKHWLVENWDKIPDFICAASDFDLVLACLIRLEYGIKTTGGNMGDQIFPAEIPRGYLGHVWHHSTWNTRDVNAVPSNIHNRKLFREMRDKHLPELKLTEQNTLA